METEIDTELDDVEHKGKQIRYSPQKLRDLIDSFRPYSAMLENKHDQIKLLAQNDLFTLMKYECIVDYYYALLDNPRSKIVASVEIAVRKWWQHYNADGFHSVAFLQKKAIYRAACIREWTKQFYVHNQVTQSKRGKHSKSISLLTHEDVKTALLRYLRAQKPDSISISSFCNAAKLILEEMGYGEDMSESTARRWLFQLGFFRWEYKKGIYVDGHERPDVVQYRKYFVEKMAEYRLRIPSRCIGCGMPL